MRYRRELLVDICGRKRRGMIERDMERLGNKLEGAVETVYSLRSTDAAHLDVWAGG
jgi:hypothetical protein